MSHSKLEILEETIQIVLDTIAILEENKQVNLVKSSRESLKLYMELHERFSKELK